MDHLLCMGICLKESKGQTERPIVLTKIGLFMLVLFCCFYSSKINNQYIITRKTWKGIYNNEAFEQKHCCSSADEEHAVFV